MSITLGSVGESWRRIGALSPSAARDPSLILTNRHRPLRGRAYSARLPTAVHRSAKRCNRSHLQPTNNGRNLRGDTDIDVLEDGDIPDSDVDESILHCQLCGSSRYTHEQSNARQGDAASIRERVIQYSFRVGLASHFHCSVVSHENSTKLA
jgi:hypothetical protein